MCALLVLAFAANAQAQYVQRHVQTTAGAITFIGNSLGLNKDSNGDAPGNDGSIGTFITTDTFRRENSSWPQGTTSDWRQNSSSAILSLPPFSRVLYAELIWGGSYNFGGENVQAFLNDPVNFTTPRGIFQITPDTATRFIDSGSNANFYSRSANVTALVQAGGNGTYVTGRVPGTQGTSEDNLNGAGWTLAIVYENFSLPTRNLSIFVGLEQQEGAAASVSGFCTADSASQRARVAVSAIEGDPAISGDTLRFGPNAANLGQSQYRLSGPNNPIDNFFVSQINGDTGNLVTTGTFGDRNTDIRSNPFFAGGRQSWDITNVDASAQLQRTQTVAFARGTSTGDAYQITALGLQIDVGAAQFAFNGAASVNRLTAVVGDVLTYTVRLDNTAGIADATGVVFHAGLPSSMAFVAGSFTVNGVATAGNPSAPAGASIGTVATGTTKTVTYQARLTSIPTAPEPGQIDVTPRWTYSFISCAGQPPQQGTHVANTVTTFVAQVDALKSASPSPVQANHVLTYTIAVSNTGTAPTIGTLVTDIVPAGTAYVANSTEVNGTVVPDQGGTTPLAVGVLVSSAGQPPGVILPDTTGIITFQVRVDAPRTSPVTNVATIDPDGPNGLSLAFTRNVITNVTPVADLSVTQSGPTTAAPGTTVAYVLIVRNAGPSTAAGVTLTNPTPAGLTLVSVTGACTAFPCNLATVDSGAVVTTTVTFQVPPSYTTPDPIVNTATVSSSTQDPAPGNNTSTHRRRSARRSRI